MVDDPYLKLIASALRANQASFLANTTIPSIERGRMFAACLLDPAAIQQSFEPLAPDDLPIVDAAGHRRPEYRGLLVYSWAKSLELCQQELSPTAIQRWNQTLVQWRDVLMAEISEIVIPTNGFTAEQGSTATLAAWHALALFSQNKLPQSKIFDSIVKGQQPGGQLLKTTSHDNPETHWYHELVLLHALASYAVQSNDVSTMAAVERATNFHLNETQPDHATNQPWAVFAFLSNPSSRIVADQLLHAATAQHPQGLDAISLMLLADALYCLRLKA